MNPALVETVMHVAIALKHHVRRCREQAVPVPPLLIEVRDWSQAVASGLSSSPPPLPSDDAGVVAVLLRLPEAADRLGCSVTTVKKLIANGELPTVQLLGQRRVRLSDLESFVDSLGDGTFRDRVQTKETA